MIPLGAIVTICKLRYSLFQLVDSSKNNFSSPYDGAVDIMPFIVSLMSSIHLAYSAGLVHQVEVTTVKLDDIRILTLGSLKVPCLPIHQLP